MAAEALGESHNTILVYRKDVVGSNFTITKYRLPCLSEADLYTLWQLIRIINTEKVEAIIPTKRKDYFLAGIAGKLTGTPVILRLGADRQLRDPWQRLTYHTLTSGIIVNAEKDKKKPCSRPATSPKAKSGSSTTASTPRKSTKKQSQSRKSHSPSPLQPSVASPSTKGSTSSSAPSPGSCMRTPKLTPASSSWEKVPTEQPSKNSPTNSAYRTGSASRLPPEPLPHRSRQATCSSWPPPMKGSPTPSLKQCTSAAHPSAPTPEESGKSSPTKKIGYLLSHGDEARLAAILSELYRNKPTRAAIAKAAQETVIRQFSIPRMAKEIAKFCQDTTQSTENTET